MSGFLIRHALIKDISLNGNPTIAYQVPMERDQIALTVHR